MLYDISISYLKAISVKTSLHREEKDISTRNVIKYYLYTPVIIILYYQALYY